MAGNIKGIIVEIGGDTSGLQNALKKVNSSTSSLSKELKGINSLLKLDPKNTELLAQKQTVLKKNIEDTSKKLESLKEIQTRYIESGGDLNSEKYRNLQREIINTENKLKELKLEASKWTTSGRSIEEFGKKVKGVSDKVNALGTTLTTRLTLPIAGLAVGMVNAAKDFETAYTGVEKTVDGTEEQMKKIREGIKNMAEELPSTTTEIAAVAEAAGQLGIQTDNILDFSKAMIDLGNSTNLTSDQAASQLAKFANITEMSQKDFDKLGSSIVDLGNNFATTEADIVNMSQRLAGAGHQVGMSEGQILGLATALSSVGIEAEMGGSAMSKAMVKMQNAVELGGGELNEVLSKTHMSLRDLELMSKNSTKDFNELCNSIGMTNTEVKQLITAGTNLEDFADVAGMTANQFEKAWKEDAAGALTAFIKGLGKTDKKGKSAIAVLSKMGITEVRLRDSMLRSANAGDLLSDAIDTGTKAWKDNTALAKEANKRYQTLDSRLQMTKNKVINVATNTGEKLTPTINVLMDKVDGLIDKFSGLNEEETKNVIKTAAIVAAIGPALKILGTIGGTVGSVAQGVGTLSQAIGVLKTGGESANATVNSLASGMKLMSNQYVLAAAAVAGLTAATIILIKKHQESINGLNGLRKEVDQQTNSWNELKKSRDENLNSYTGEISKNQKLAQELDTIVDKNGKIKKGYEERAKFITGELSNSLGTEIKLNQNVIEQYDKVKSKINELITAKKAEALMNAYQEEYQTALKNQAEATRTLTQLKQQQTEKTKELVTADTQQRYEIQQTLSTLAGTIKEQTDLIGEYGYTVENYENLQTASVSGSADKIQEAVDKMGVSWEQAKRQEGESVEDQLLNQALYVEGLNSSLKEAENANNTYQANVLKTQKESAEKQLESLKGSLLQQTSTIEGLSDEQVTSWKALAQGSLDTYNKVIRELPVDTANKIQEATGVVVRDTSLETATKNVAIDATDLYSNNFNIGKTTQEKAKETSIQLEKYTDNVKKIWNDMGKNMSEEQAKEVGIWLGMVAQTETYGGKIDKETTNLVNNIIKSYDSMPNETKEAMKDAMDPMLTEMKVKEPTLFAKASDIANGILSRLKKAFDIHSPSRETKKIFQNVMFGAEEGLDSEKKSLYSQVDTISNGIIDEMKKELDIHSPSKKAKDQVGKNIALGVIEGVKSQKANAKKSAKKLSSLYVSAAKDKISSLKTANKINEAQEVQYWETILKYAKKGTTAYSTALNQLNKAKKTLKNDVAKVTKQYIQDVAEVQKELNESIADLKKNYNDTINSRKEEIVNSLNLFSGVELDEAISKEQLTKNLKSQVDALKDWDNVLKNLESKIGNNDLIKDLQGQGISSLNILKQLNSMSKTELAEYVKLYDKKNSIAMQRAKTENEDLLKETNAQIEILNKNAEKKMASLKNTYIKELTNLGVTAKGKSEDVGKQITNGIKTGMTTGMKDLSKSMKKQIENLVNGVKKQLKIKSPSRVFRDEIGRYMALGIGVGFEDNVSTAYEQINTSINDETKKLQQELNNVQIGDFGKLQGKINSSVIDRTKTIFTTPQIVFNVQELDKARLQQCFNYINRKFGSQY